MKALSRCRSFWYKISFAWRPNWAKRGQTHLGRSVSLPSTSQLTAVRRQAPCDGSPVKPRTSSNRQISLRSTAPLLLRSDRMISVRSSHAILPRRVQTAPGAGSIVAPASRHSDMDIAYISALSALAGSVIGGFTSGVTTWLNQHSQARAERFAHDLGRREELYRAREELRKHPARPRRRRRKDLCARWKCCLKRGTPPQPRKAPSVEMLVKFRPLDRPAVRFNNPSNIKGLVEQFARDMNR